MIELPVKLIHYNPFRSTNKYLKTYLEDRIQKQIVMATPQRAYAHFVNAYNNKSKKFSDWPVFSLAMMDLRVEKEQLNPVLFKMGLAGDTISDGDDIVYVNWMPVTISYQLDWWADTRNRLEAYQNILLMTMMNYPSFTIYYQESNKAYSIAVINVESPGSDTSNLDPGEDLVEFRRTMTFSIITQIPILSRTFPSIDNIIEHFWLTELDQQLSLDSTGQVVVEEGVQLSGTKTVSLDSSENIQINYDGEID